jgi:NADH dehydrogenase FAD-containing subunit
MAPPAADYHRQTIIILGGGIGGQVATSRLGRALRGRHRVVVIERWWLWRWL